MRGATSDDACAVRIALRGAGGVGLGHRSGGHAMPKCGGAGCVMRWSGARPKFAARRAFAEAEELQILKSKQRFFDNYFPSGVGLEDGRVAAFEPRGTLSLKVTKGEGLLKTTSYHVLGSFSAEPLITPK